jgi:hypothetical protein
MLILNVLNNESQDITQYVSFNDITEKIQSWKDSGEKFTWKFLNDHTGGLSSPSKMPCHGWSISAKICRTGGKLRKVKGSVCSNCYALKGRYVFSNVENAMEWRLDALKRDPVAWAAAMVLSIRKTGNNYFRWHDSGDLLGRLHFYAIVQIALHLPDVKFWLPTREKEFAQGHYASNLVVRVSAPMIGKATTSSREEFHNTSSVGAGVGYACPAQSQDNQCGSCRACWSRDVVNVDYAVH